MPEPSVVNAGDKKRKRPRAARACEWCRAKKYRCDELFPCSQCKRQKVECVYDVADHVRQRMFSFNASNEQHAASPLSQHENGTVATEGSKGRSHSQGGSANPALLDGDMNMPPPSSSSPLSTHISPRPRSDARNLSQASAGVAVGQNEDDHDVEISDVNLHTRNVEFHGKTSSIAFLAALQPQPTYPSNSPAVGQKAVPAAQSSLVSVLHNEAFSPEALATTQSEAAALATERYHFRQAQIFLEGYFQNLHFIHPILDRQRFMTRCEDLWFGRPEQQPKSFVALYYSIMSLGALIKTWDEDKFDGLGRLEWSRKFFNLTRTAIGGLASMTAIESIQCLFFMAKISQNELNPSLAYLYLGWATRASFSAGFNRRQASPVTESDSSQDQISKLWWGLYSLEIEVSFALGRPDSLGPDVYHNQIMPALDETETAIIPVMVEFARIIREVSVSIYLSDGVILEKTATALQIETQMKDWLQQIPGTIRPTILDTHKVQKIFKAPTWAKRQKLVLELRYYNVKMVLFRPFLTIAAKFKRNAPEAVVEAMDKCVDAARCTIQLMHEMYCHHSFFRTWWYNTTYILYAATIVLCYGIKIAQQGARSECLELGQKAVEILDAMEESTVAKNASHTVKQLLSSIDEASGPAYADGNTENEMVTTTSDSVDDNSTPQFAQFADDSLLSFLNLDENFDFLAMTFPLNNSHFPLWNDVEDQV